MTPKEKAIELVETFAETLPPAIEDTIIVRNWVSSIQCALIAVDEIIDLLSTMPSSISLHFINYYNEVKNEINKL
jgi:hypothetical protein